MSNDLPALFVVDGSSGLVGRDGNETYAVYRVVRADDRNHLICAFYGGASYSAAWRFCEQINADPKWRSHIEGAA